MTFRINTAVPAPRAAATVTRTPQSTRGGLAGASARPAVFPSLHTGTVSCFTPRGPRFVDFMACSLCGAPRVGIEYHGELRSGAKVHETATHAPGRGNRRGEQPTCLGSKVRVVFVGGDWRPQ
jgi:hypothetical protein